MKKRISMLLACAMMLALASCGGNNGNNSGNAGNQSNAGGNTSGSTGVNSSASTSQGGGAADYHIAIITGSDTIFSEAISSRFLLCLVASASIACPTSGSNREINSIT